MACGRNKMSRMARRDPSVNISVSRPRCRHPIRRTDVSNRRIARYAVALSALLGLFVLRVWPRRSSRSATAPSFRPGRNGSRASFPIRNSSPASSSSSSCYGKVCLDFIRQRGFFVTPRRWLGTLLLSVGSVYLAVMVIRYAIRMSLYPPERWTGGSIPIVFHWVLAAFILVLGDYHRRSFPVQGPPIACRRVDPIRRVAGYRRRHPRLGRLSTLADDSRACSTRGGRSMPSGSSAASR